MASRKDNLKALFQNTRSRIMIILTAFIVIVATLIGVYKLSSDSDATKYGSSSLNTAPGSIQSIPGALDPTAEYAKLQALQNVTQAQVAEKTGGSAIPTIIKTQTIGDGVNPIGIENAESGAGFVSLNLASQGGPQKSLWLQELNSSNCSKTIMNKVMAEGATLKEIAESCSCIQLKENGVSLTNLMTVCRCSELKDAGVAVVDFKNIGVSASDLKQCGYSACAMKGAGFTAEAMKEGGYSDGELQGAGFSNKDIQEASGIPDGLTTNDIQKAGCDPIALSKLRQAGVSALAIRSINGCSAAQLKAAGYDATQLKNAGFTAADLKNAGFSAKDLKNAGFSPRELLNAGFTPTELSAAGFSPQQIQNAETTLPPGISDADVKAAGCDPSTLKMERLAGVSAYSIRKDAGCSLAALKQAGFSDADLLNAGFSPDALKNNEALTDSDIRKAGCSPAGIQMLRLKGVSAEKIHALNGCSKDQLTAGGFNLADATKATESDAIRNAGCDPTKLASLRLAGVSAATIREKNGCDLNALKNAGFDAKALSDAGFTPAQLLGAGFTNEDLAKAGLSPASIIAAGRLTNCDIDNLKAAKAMGVSAETIRKTLGCSASALKQAGYTAKDLRDAGYTAGELKAAGFDAAALKAAGFSAKDLKDAGFTAEQLKNAGFSPKALKEAGFTAAQLKNAGFTADQLKNAGFSAKALKDAGFTASQLKAAGFDATALKDAGFSAEALKNAGFSPADLKKAGFTAKDLLTAGFKPNELLNAGFSQDDLKGASTDLAGIQFSPNDATPNVALPSNGLSSTLPSVSGSVSSLQANQSQQLEKILEKQNQRLDDQRFQQKIQQRTSEMLSSANQYLSGWKNSPTQSYNQGEAKDEKGGAEGKTGTGEGVNTDPTKKNATGDSNTSNAPSVIKAGDIIFAVLDTAVNTDEPGPVLATIVSGKLKGSKLIGSFNLPGNATKIILSFNTLSIPSANKTIQVNAVAIDPNTARTALASKVDEHYLLRYGSLFASSFLQGFGNAIQSANTTITIGGTGGGNDISISGNQNGVGLSLLENAVIGLATVGRTWGQIAQQQFNRPATIELYSGTGMGILFTQDLKLS
jgi:intracellular multiplication protein IcmE